MKRYFLPIIFSAIVATATAEVPADSTKRDTSSPDQIVILTDKATASFIVSTPYKKSEDSEDKILSIDKPSKVTITESPSGINFIIDKQEGDSLKTTTYTQEYVPNAFISTHQRSYLALEPTIKKPTKWNVIIGGLGFGCVSAPNAGIDIEPMKSYEMSLLYLLGIRYRVPGHNNNLIFGIGFDWRNYRTTTGQRFINDGNTVTVGSFDEGCTPKYSNLRTFGWQFPVMWEQYLPIKGFNDKNISVRLGAVFNWNTHASTTSSWYTSENVDIHNKVASVNMRHFTVDYMAMLKLVPGVGAYVRYTPTNILTGTASPNLRALSFGLIFGI